MEAISIIQRYYPLSILDQKKLESLFQRIQIDKNTVIIQSGKTSNYLYFIKTGSCRIFYHKDGREVILDFAFPGDVLISLNSYIYGKTGYETIQTMEIAELYQIDTRLLEEFYRSSIGIANWGRKLAEIETLKIESRLMSKLFKNASESYQELMERAPKMIHTIKLGYIASYLGISQVTLSRIRGKI